MSSLLSWGVLLYVNALDLKKLSTWVILTVYGPGSKFVLILVNLHPKEIYTRNVKGLSDHFIGRTTVGHALN